MAAVQAPPRTRRQPVRTCVACRVGAAKRELVRVVRAPTGAVAVDESGRAAGRGAYIGLHRPCWELALRGDRLSHALRTTVGEADRAALTRFAATLPPTACPNQPPSRQRRDSP